MRERSGPCPVCDAAKIMGAVDSEEGRLLEETCTCPACGLWDYHFAYGQTQERIGWFWLAGSWTDSIEEQEAERELSRQVLAEIRAAYRHPEFAGVRKGPRGVLGDWLREHGFEKQGAAVMNCVPEILYLPIS